MCQQIFQEGIRQVDPELPQLRRFPALDPHRGGHLSLKLVGAQLLTKFQPGIEHAPVGHWLPVRIPHASSYHIIQVSTKDDVFKEFLADQLEERVHRFQDNLRHQPEVPKLNKRCWLCDAGDGIRLTKKQRWFVLSAIMQRHIVSDNSTIMTDAIQAAAQQIIYSP